MQYLGGKNRIRKEIASFLWSVREIGQTYFEPFVGGAWVLQEMDGKRIASDGNKALITMYKALQDGWTPPNSITENEYCKYKHNQVIDDPLTAFIGIGCSFGGKWFGGFIGNGDRGKKAKCSVKSSTDGLLKQLPLIKDVAFYYGLFHEHKPEGMLIYCDPPYEGTTQYGAFTGFDHKLFWNTIREWAKKNIIVISEYKAPDDFKCVYERSTTMSMYDKTGNQQMRVERLFMYKE